MRLFKGRMNRATYWSCLVLMVVLIALFRLPSAIGSGLGMMFGMSVFRLHDIGRSGKWALPPLILVVTAIFLPLLLVATLGAAAATPMALIVLTSALVVLGSIAWLGSRPGEPNDNRFGPPPKPGVTLIKDRRQAPVA